MNRKSSFMDRFRSMKIRNKIIVFYMTIVLISVLLSAFLYLRISDSYLDRTIYNLSINEVQNHNRSLELLLEDINTYSKEIISSPSIQTALDPNQEQVYQLKKVDQELAASMMFDNKISSVYVFDFEGKKYYRDKRVFKNLQMEDIMAKSWYQDLVDLRGGYLYNFNGEGLIVDRDYDYLSFFRIINSNVNHQPVGVLMINIEDETIRDIFNITDDDFKTVVIRELSYMTEMTFSDRQTSSLEGRYFQDSSEAEKVKVMEDIDSSMDQVFGEIKAQQLYYGEDRIYKQDMIMTGLRNDAYEWMIAEVSPGRDTTSMIALFNIAIAVILAINSVMIIYGSVWFAGYITNPITELTKSMKAVEEGNFIPVDVPVFHDEIGSLKDGYNYMIVEIQQLIEAIIKEEKVIKDAEFRVIMEQIKPHFMYNTLDSINALMMLGRNDEAGKALTALAKFYRSSLSDGRTVVTVDTELQIIKNYLLIQNIRYKDLFEVVYDIDERVLDLKVPKLMLQPLIENSLYHGIRPMGMDGLITVRVKSLGSKVLIEVWDNGMGMEASVIQQVFAEAYDPDGDMSSLGLPATLRRVKHMYEDKCEIQIISDQSGTLIRIEIEVTQGGIAS